MACRLPPNLAVLVAAILFASEALAGGFSEGGNGNTAPGSSTQAGAQVVATCGAQSWSAGTLQPNTQDTAGNPCPPVSAPLGSGGATAAKQDTTNTDLGPPGATACATDNGSCSLNALIERTNQRITSLITALGSPFQAGAALGAGTAATALRVELPTDGTGKVGLNATQNSIGNVGGKTVRVCVAPTVTSATYGANVVMGGLLSFANLFTSTGSGIIQSISLDFTTVQSVGFKLYPFTSNPSNTTWTEHSAAAINSADIFKVDPFISLTNYDGGLGTMTNYSLTGLGQSYSSGGTTGYFILVPTATTATLGGTASVVQVCVTVIQDL